MSDTDQREYEPGVARVLQSKQERQAFYDKIAGVYDLLSESTEQAVRNVGVRKLAPAPGEHVLEIGFGTGHILVELARAVSPGGRVFGIDISPNMLTHAHQTVAQDGADDIVELTCGDAETLPYSDGSMDGIFMCFTLELFDTPEMPRVLAECQRVLKPGGRIVVAGISKEGKPGLVIKAFEWTHRHFPNLMDCRPIYVAQALDAAGFRVKDKSIEHMWVPVEVVLAENGA